MGVKENEELVRLQFELLNSGDTEGAARLWAQEASNHGRKVDPKSIAKVYESLRSLHESHTIHEVVAAGEWVAVRTTCHGIHSAEPAIPVNSGIFAGVAPTGKEYTVQHLHLFKVVNGQITEHWANRDDLGAARQIGLELRTAKDSARSP